MLGTIFVWWYNPTIIGKEQIPHEGPVVLAGNHKHAFDPIFVGVCTKRPIHILAKKELHDSVFGWFFRLTRTIAVDLEAERNPKAFAEALTYLNDGNVVNLSPEAERNYTEQILLPFKFGAVVLAKRTGCPLIPYAITGDYRFRSRNLKITVLPPIDISDLSIDQSNEKLFNTIKDQLSAAQGREPS